MSFEQVDQHPYSVLLSKRFHICNAFYKSVDHQPIGCHVLIPRESPGGKRPLLVRIHGGGFSEGTSDSWFRPWVLELALKHQAVVVTPDYRLRPEAQLTEQLDDLRDFWRWIGTSLPEIPGVEVDVQNLAVVGESAGGTLAAQTALLGMIDPIRVIMLQYPCLDFAHHIAREEAVPAEEKVSAQLLDDHMARAIPGHIVTRWPNPLRMDLVRSMMQHGRFADLQKDPSVDPINNVEKAEKMPPVFLFHGRQDSAVSIECSNHWAEKLRMSWPDVPFHYEVLDGEHILDRDSVLSSPWIKEPIEFVERFWPAK